MSGERRHDRKYRASSRERDRSRSPWRPGKPSSRDTQQSKSKDKASRNESEEPRSRESSKQPPSSVAAEEMTEPEAKRVKFDNAAKPPAEDPVPLVDPEPLDEEAEIERRRRERQAKREALLNKTKPSSLLTQALNVPTPADSVPATPPMDTPSRESRAVTPTISNPSTPRHDSAPNSPLRAEELARQLEGLGDDDGEEQSAAMYDPNMDVDEDRARHEAERTRNGELPAGAYDERKDKDRKDVPVAELTEQTKAPKIPTNDMFADDSDDDMFAVGDKPLESTNAVKPEPMSAQGRALAADLHDNWDTPDGFYKTIVGELIDHRYVVKAALGKGVFATVIRAQDTQSKKLVAIKIVRNNEAMRKAGMKEIDILTKLAQADLDDHFHIVRLHRHFVHKNHLCMVFENLGSNLRDLVKSYGRKTGLELQVVKSYAVQMFKALVLLRKCEILHADLKPDNILSDAGTGKKIKIADLGSATAASDNEITPYLASRFYRAPEVMLGIPPQYSIDMWAIGCTLFELYTDAILFVGKSNNEMLKAIQECRGKISKKVIRRGTDELKYAHFDANLELFGSVERVGIPPKDTIRWINFGSQPVPGKDIKTRLLRAANKKGTTKADQLKELDDFRDLLDKCLKLDPEERITPRQALAHRFCSGKSTATMTGKAGGRY
ncbi:hypothetical protein, variant [Verruconis gallopava]|nr:hypothetical protein, variant [Verruconis gallopava]KIW08250.1 hypothetical protein, variant [Verruconis gallopava]